jgi:hypothetical protein
MRETLPHQVLLRVKWEHDCQEPRSEDRCIVGALRVGAPVSVDIGMEPFQMPSTFVLFICHFPLRGN